jgi:hypothetical protein
MDANVSNKVSCNRLQMCMAIKGFTKDLHRRDTMLVSYESNSTKKSENISRKARKERKGDLESKSFLFKTKKQAVV